jgi:uncharacterized protein
MLTLVMVLLSTCLAMPTAFGQAQESSVARYVQAAQRDDVSILGRLSQLGLNIDSRDGLGNNLLMLAIREKAEQLALAILLNPRWADSRRLEQENRLGESALMLAAHRGMISVASRLIELGAQTNREGWGPIHYAATTGQTEMIRLLLDHHAYIDAVSPNGSSALMMAARFRHATVARLLVQLGADPTLINDSGMSAKLYANENQDNDLAFWLELEEISFTTKYLQNLPVIDLDELFTPKVDGPAPDAAPSDGVQVVPGIQ